MIVSYSKKGWTYGAEHELGDWSIDRGLPKGSTRATDDYTMVNSNGVGNDPKAKMYQFGGEINTPPTDTPNGQVAILGDIKSMHPEAVVNYRSNLHVHIRVPGLRDDLDALKQLASYNAANIAEVLPVIEPIPEPFKNEYATKEEYEGARRRWRRRRVSHHTVIPKNRLAGQLAARTPKEFFDAEPPRSSTGRILWHAQPRAAVNVRQLLQTDTIEFRHFPGTLKLSELYAAISWCETYLFAALNQGPPAMDLIEEDGYFGLPKFPEYQHWQEVRYRATCHDGTLERDVIAENIHKIEDGTFDVYANKPRKLPL